jgi:hypothetical protein
MEKFEPLLFFDSVNAQLEIEYVVFEKESDLTILGELNLGGENVVEIEDFSKIQFYKSIIFLINALIPWEAEEQLDKLFLIRLQDILNEQIVKIDVDTLKKSLRFKFGKFTNVQTSSMIYTSMLHILSHDQTEEFHEILHNMMIYLYTIFDIYKRCGSDILKNFLINFQYARTLPRLGDEIRKKLSLKSFDEFDDLIVHLSKTTRTNPKNLFFERFSTYCDLFYTFHGVKLNYTLENVFTCHLKSNIEYYDWVYPFYHLDNKDLICLVPFIIINLGVLNKIIGHLIENSEHEKLEDFTLTYKK